MRVWNLDLSLTSPPPPHHLQINLWAPMSRLHVYRYSYTKLHYTLTLSVTTSYTCAKMCYCQILRITFAASLYMSRHNSYCYVSSETWVLTLWTWTHIFFRKKIIHSCSKRLTVCHLTKRWCGIFPAVDTVFTLFTRIRRQSFSRPFNKMAIKSLRKRTNNNTYINILFKRLYY